MKQVHYIDNITPIACSQWFYANIRDSYATPYETNPTKGEHDFNGCEVCQNDLHRIKDQLTSKFNGLGKWQGREFPLCCSYHSKLPEFKEFNRDDFLNVPDMVAKKIIYTKQHIKNNYFSDNYYKEITDYIEYTIESFGLMPKDCGEPLFLGEYFSQILYYVEAIDDEPIERKGKLKEFLISSKNPKRHNPITDINVLVSTYQTPPNQLSLDFHCRLGIE